MISKRTQKIFLRSSMRSMIFSIYYQPLQGLLSIHIQMISIDCYIRQIAIKAGDTVVIVTIPLPLIFSTSYPSILFCFYFLLMRKVYRIFALKLWAAVKKI